MTLAALLEKQFRADLRFRGQGYVKAERVSIRLVRPDHIEAVVRDGVDHLVRIDRTDGKLSMHCTCDQFQKLQVCKHLWAVILTIDAEGLLSSEPTPGHIPPFVAEEEEDWTAADDLDEGELLAELAAVAATRGKSDFLEDIDDDGEDDFPGGNAGGVATAVGRRQKVADWERPLVDLAAELKGEGRKANAEAREREIFFEIDRDASVEEGVLVMQLSQRQRRVNGQWGKLKALKLRPTELDKVEHEDDRTVLAYLLGGTPDRSDWVAQKTESNATVSRFQIPHELSVRLMPMLAASGRMRYLDSDEPQPLAWDDGDPWELTAAVEPADPGDGDGESDPGEPAWTLAGQLHRGDEVLPLGDVLGVVRGGLVLFEDRVTRLRDIARVELGSQDYNLNAYLDNKTATAIVIFQQPGSNALETAGAVLAEMEANAAEFPPGLAYSVVYNPTEFISQSIDAVIETFIQALLLVVLVIVVFLQSWRAAIIPLVAIPVSIIATFAVMAMLGFSVNVLTLFGLILAI
ncbi:MAG: efflux RND transporter permease subunit, partial [Planctomycetota bacterium]